VTRHRIVALIFVLFIFANSLATTAVLLKQVNPDKLMVFRQKVTKKGEGTKLPNVKMGGGG
jgi:hypothetical protein